MSESTSTIPIRHCSKCGKEIYGSWVVNPDGSEVCHECAYKPCAPQYGGGYYGWVCPVCGRGNSPYTSSCPCNPAPIPKVTF